MDAVTTSQTLEQRITARLHESIGDLITDDDLKGMVARGIETALFKGRRIEKRNSWGTTDHYDLPPLLEEQVNLLLTSRMEVAIHEWLKDNPEKIEQALRDVMTDGAGTAMIRALDHRFHALFDQGVLTLQSRGLLPRGNG